jgi:hypothetical protein
MAKKKIEWILKGFSTNVKNSTRWKVRLFWIGWWVGAWTNSSEILSFLHYELKSNVKIHIYPLKYLPISCVVWSGDNKNKKTEKFLYITLSQKKKLKGHDGYNRNKQRLLPISIFAVRREKYDFENNWFFHDFQKCMQMALALL